MKPNYEKTLYFDKKEVYSDSKGTDANILLEEEFLTDSFDYIEIQYFGLTNDNQKVHCIKTVPATHNNFIDLKVEWWKTPTSKMEELLCYKISEATLVRVHGNTLEVGPTGITSLGVNNIKITRVCLIKILN